tara:strand:+ start:830 stop:2032 length:1203 start_codon:yes stop_codon:yes gene_type:complete
MIRDPYSFTNEDIEKYSGLEDNNLSKGEKIKVGIPISLEKNTKIKDYTINKLLGEGTYSFVWSVSKNNKNYAIKMTKPDNNEEKVTENEISLLKKYNKSDYIISLHDTFYHKDNNKKYLCMVMDELGCDLHILKRMFKYKNSYYDTESESNESSGSVVNEPIIAVPFKLAKKITIQILKGLDYIHSNNIIHTDIKLDNILIEKNILDIKNDNDVNIKICDFGTSHFTSDKSNFSVGTIDYSAPECILGYPYGKGIDVWATGCILFEIITGICLFDYTRYYDDASDVSSGFSSSSYDNENDKTQVESLLLCMMKRILGEFPSKIFKKGKYYENYFDYKGRFRFFPNFLEEDTILDSLTGEFNYDESYAIPFNNFLLKLLCINPNNRKNVKTLLKDEWLLSE